MENFYDPKNKEYYQEGRVEVQRIVNPGSRTIMDIGCGAGNLGVDLKQKFDSEVWGIEIIDAAAQIAAEKLDKVLVGDAVEEVLNTPDQYFDTIIMADVLEHLVDPWSLLKNTVPKLKDNGEIVISVPNVGHWFVIKLLLNSEFYYSGFGTLDKTHLRFFTKKSAIRMLDEAGLYVLETFVTKADFEKIPIELLEACSKIGVDKNELEEDSAVFQFIFRTVKKSEIDKILEHVNDFQEKIKQQDYNSAIDYINLIINKFREFRIKQISQVNLDYLLQLQNDIKEIINREN